jgi:hypothetical protein
MCRLLEYFGFKNEEYIFRFPSLIWNKKGKAMTLRTLQLRFCFPPLYGIYDTGDGTIYIFGEHEEEIEEVVSHEVLHWVLQKIAGKQASLSLDNVSSEFLEA